MVHLTETWSIICATCVKELVIHTFQQRETHTYTSLICTCCEKGRGLNAVASLFTTDVIAQNIVCGQGPSSSPLMWLCQGCTHVIPALSHTNVLCFVHKTERKGSKNKKREKTLVLFRSFHWLPGARWHPPDLRIRKQCEGLRAFPKPSKSETRYGSY